MNTKQFATSPVLTVQQPFQTTSNQADINVQKLITGLKSEWSEEFIYWKETSDSYKKILKLESLKKALGKTSLTILSRQLDTLIQIEFLNIEKDINILFEQAHQGFELEGFDYMEGYWDLKNEINYFRKQARNIQICALQHINRHLPLYIF